MSAALLHTNSTGAAKSAGALLAAQLRVSPRLLEELLEALASAEFPIDPEIRHPIQGRRGGVTVVRFSVAETHLPDLRDLLATSGFAPSLLEIEGSLDEPGARFDHNS